MASITALAGREEGTRTIEVGEHAYLEMENVDGSFLRVRYDVEVVDGASVNVYFMDADAFEDYEAGRDFDFFEVYSEEDTDAYDASFVVDKEGKYYLVAETTATAANETSEIEFNIEWESVYEPGFNWLWCISSIIMVIVITAALAFMKTPDAIRERQEEVELPPVRGDEGP
ncbi:MAG: hypothetical protein GWN18_18270 [Thermoplasmata archaeon]|nr:hypothetical protein [Thermoplasmata archaeon]NIS14072.1 hypothetical protein [Thermoplasmata archaeon]NIS21913.1 hypothetical protein [Thermoplasmata archaeon]NIT79516.1 hypothetical protein [Thermoplasmata archaeon]NIU50945.1 hypothetical protein [Thermoplasmata archaeon]